MAIEAPEVVVPVRSDSDEMILVDLGKLKISNSFFIVSAESKAIAEDYDITLSDLQVFRCSHRILL